MLLSEKVFGLPDPTNDPPHDPVYHSTEAPPGTLFAVKFTMPESQIADIPEIESGATGDELTVTVFETQFGL